MGFQFFGDETTPLILITKNQEVYQKITNDICEIDMTCFLSDFEFEIYTFCSMKEFGKIRDLLLRISKKIDLKELRPTKGSERKFYKKSLYAELRVTYELLSFIKAVDNIRKYDGE